MTLAQNRGPSPPWARPVSAGLGRMAAMKINLPDGLSDDRVSLRPMVPSDAAPYAAAFREDPDLGRLLGVEQDPDEETVGERIEAETQPVDDRAFFKLAIADPVSGAFWGEVIVHGFLMSSGCCGSR